MVQGYYLMHYGYYLMHHRYYLLHCGYDLMHYGNEQAVKAEGKYIQKGKEYVVEDGDIIFFRFNVNDDKMK